MGVREHNFGDKLSPKEFIVTAYFVDSEFSSSEEMDFIVTPGTSQAEVKEFARAWAERELNPDMWDRINLGQPSVPMVYR